MQLSTLLANTFSLEVRRRGRAYYQAGRVRITEGTAWLVWAQVRGSSRYQVTLSRQDTHLQGSCACPYSDGSGEPCKHLWATILAAEARGYLLGAGNNQSLSFAVLQGDDPQEDGEAMTTLRDLARRPPPVLHPREVAKSGALARHGAANQERPPLAPWKKVLTAMQTPAHLPLQPQAPWPAGQELLYIIDVPATLSGGLLVLELAIRQRRKSTGEWGKMKSQRIPGHQLRSLPEALDRQVLATLLGAREHYSYGYYYNAYSYDTTAVRYQLADTLQHLILPLLCQTGRCWLRLSPTATEFLVLSWDAGAPWEFHLHLQPDAGQRQYVMTGRLQRDGEHGVEQMTMAEPVMLMHSGFLFTQERVARLEHHGAFAWIPHLRQQRTLTIPFAQGQEFLADFLSMPEPPRIDLPVELQYDEVALVPQPQIRLRTEQQRGWTDRVFGEVSFNYGGQIIAYDRAGNGVYNAEARRLLRRHRTSEQAALATLQDLGFREQRYAYEAKPVLAVAASKLPRVVRQLMESGWVVEAEGKLYRRPGAFKFNVTSGIDWFELHGSVDFDGVTAQLPALLAALQRGENTVRLDDGTYGVMPEEWLQKYGLLASLGTRETDHVRFTRAQAGLLDALLAAQPAVSVDATFASARAALQRFEGITPTDPPAAFQGILRGYQREGLGWLHFLREFGFGGCLADDMGLGKTVQVLALLAARREHAAPGQPSNGTAPAPSLVVVPKSLVFNWQQEAMRFTPHLRVLDHTGQGRKKEKAGHFEAYDIILTTYGTLRNDAVLFKDVRFDYVILDEAQAIKNAGTESAKAARLLQGDYKLALSGTPIENHLGELWSLCEFLNPGLLGAASTFNLTSPGGRNPDVETRQILAQALRPFILRRTKAQVARDLPAKIEQTIYCELEPKQRKLYNELRDHYRRSLLGNVTPAGINKSKILILEALLRLRQAACHPGLLDTAKSTEPSAKLEVLLPKLTEAIEEGHKTLVFSQFTSLLAIVRDRLHSAHISYEYLDGRTRNRQERVERFQTDPACKLFLISLKAGGLGLNLTAAENVFLLDPWWNPAVEAQAIDRTHRIGQTKQVFACRLIARDTVEEKVLELQNSKRDLADAIITADNSLIRNLKREDLELLLS